MKTIVAGITFLGLLTAPAHAQPLKVYILAGQSNMEGHAAVRTFDYIGLDPATRPMLADMRGADGAPTICDNVWISYLTGSETNIIKEGRLTAGYGALGGEAKIGPEFTFGITMSKRLDEPILIIKTAWGGKSLHTDFRSPSGGNYELSTAQRDALIRRGIDVEAWQAEKDRATGRYYRLMMDHVNAVLKDIGRICPAYEPEAGYELAGFVWFQGWNDMVDGQAYPDRDKPGGYDLYSELLAHFIRDVRKDLSAPDLPFVIGVMGVGGPGQQIEFRNAMEAPARLDEFKDSVVAVRTETFWDFDIERALPKQHAVNKLRDTAHELGPDGRMARRQAGIPGWETLGMPEQEDRVWRHLSVDPRLAEEIMPAGDAKRFRDVALPAELERWFMPEFDDGGWQAGKAPIGKGVWTRGGKTVHNNSDWGEGEFLLMRTVFEVNNLDPYVQFRLSVLARQGFHVYLNGHKIHTYIWWKDDPYYRSIVLSDKETQHLRKGPNLLAVYANHHCDRRNPDPHASIDVALEGLTVEGQAYIMQEMERILPPEEQAIVAGSSNAGFHYLGSAKMMGQIGRAFAEAILNLREVP